MTGENRVWYSFGAIHRAVLEGNDAALHTGVEAIKSVLVVLATADEGIQVDQTFYQHSTRIYNGGYGLQFVFDVSKWVGILAGTPLSIDGPAKAVLDNLLTMGPAGCSGMGRSTTARWGAIWHATVPAMKRPVCETRSIV